MDVFAEQILSIKSLYLIAVIVLLVLMFSQMLYRINKRIKPVYSGLIIAFTVAFFHLYISKLPFDTTNVGLTFILACLGYISAFSLAAAISKIARKTEDVDERDLTFGKKD